MLPRMYPRRRTQKSKLKTKAKALVGHQEPIRTLNSQVVTEVLPGAFPLTLAV
jgi:hypothetical protein